MLKTFSSILIFFLALSAGAQVKVDGQVTGKHRKVINNAKGAKQKAEEKKAQAKRIKEQIEAREKYRKQYDSLKSKRRREWSLDSLQLDSLQLDSLTIPEINLPDSITLPKWTKEDSLAIAEEILSQTNMQQYREMLENIDLKKPDISNADSLALIKAQAVLEEHAKSYLPTELNDASNPLDAFSNPLEGGIPDVGDGIPSVEQPTRPNPNLVKPEQAQELFKKIDPEQFQSIQEDIKGLKEKYSSLPDTRFPEEGVKRNSMEQIPFKKRIHLGGNISLQSTDPLIVDTNLQLGYWINKKWMAGVGFILREQFSKQDSLANLTGDSHGFSLFSRYTITNGFFAWGEMDLQVNKSLFQEDDTQVATWEKAYLLGIGRDFNIGPVRMNSMILYDFNHKNNNLNARPIVFKIGFQFTKKPE